VNIVGGKDMSLEEAKEVIEYVSSKLDSDAKFIWGASLSPDMGANLRVMLIMTGVKSPQIFGALAAREEREKGAANELGIEFID